MLKRSLGFVLGLSLVLGMTISASAETLNSGAVAPLTFGENGIQPLTFGENGFVAGDGGVAKPLTFGENG